MRTSFHHQPEAQHPNSSAINKLPADYPIYWHLADKPTAPVLVGYWVHSGHRVGYGSIANDPKRTNVTMTFSQCGVFGATKKALAFSSPAGAFSALP